MKVFWHEELASLWKKRKVNGLGGAYAMWSGLESHVAAKGSAQRYYFRTQVQKQESNECLTNQMRKNYDL